MPHLRFRRALVGLPVGLLLLVAVTAGMAADATSAQETATRIGIDADSAGNTATSLGDINDCVEISEGDSQTVDVFVQDVSDLLAWEAVLKFEPKVMEISDVDATLFMAANEGSEAQDVSGKLPDSDGHYQLGGFDAADPPAPDSGSGVLARLTVKGIGPGVSELSLPLSDLNGDTKPDEGPLLRNIDVENVGDVNGDTLFDGPVATARIAVDASCTDAPGPAAQAGREGQDEDGIGTLTIVVIVAGTIGSIAVGGLAAAWAVRRRLGAKG